MLREWAISKLEEVKENDRVLVVDSLHLLPETDGMIHGFARTNNFTVIVAATNLAFRELYEQAIADTETKKLLIIDRAPIRRRSDHSEMKAPPPFYPDLLAEIPEEARIDLDLRQFLREKTGDPNWPQEVKDPLYARLIVRNMEGVLRAHKNLRTADKTRFTDPDFKKIVAFASLGVADAAFKKGLDAQDYWKIGMLCHHALEELISLAPEVTKPIFDELRRSPAPFCWFADHDAETVVRAFYLSLIITQHIDDNWNLLLANIDPALIPFSDIKKEILIESAPKLVEMDGSQAHVDLDAVERSLSIEALRFLLIDQLKLAHPLGFTAVIEKERYSTLVRSLALLMALKDILSPKPAWKEQTRIEETLFPKAEKGRPCFADIRPSIPWSHLKEAYGLACDIQRLRESLSDAIKSLNVLSAQQLTFDFFRGVWNEKRINRIEYYLSALERLVESGEFLPRNGDELPSLFSNALEQIRDSIQSIKGDVHTQLALLNSRFQEMVATRYPSWIEGENAVVLTSRFINRCLKPHWDPKNENAVLFIFDGMRYDIWDEMLRPIVEDRMEILADMPALSLLPSETHITRKAISAGDYPDELDFGKGEDFLLKGALSRESLYTGEVEVLPPKGMGTGETVRYQAGNLDVYIFELCDKELHKIKTKTWQDGRQVPARPIAFIYQQHIKNIIDTEVMAILRSLAPDTKVFITADHGFGGIAREPLRIETEWLNEPRDCSYTNALLRNTLSDLHAPGKVRENVWEFPIEKLRMPAVEDVNEKGAGRSWQKKYASVIFPKTGYALSRPNSHFNPDAYSHGGISLQEMIIPMIALRVKSRAEGLLSLDTIEGPDEVVEGEEVEFRMGLKRTALSAGKRPELRVDVDAYYSPGTAWKSLPRQALYVSAKGAEVIYRIRIDSGDATDEERKHGLAEKVLTITASYREDGRTYRKSRTHGFTVRLNSERIVRRVPAHLGNILGLTPKSMR